jgi:hypothetical protein
VVEVWPENWPHVLLFEAMSTQWRVGPGGAIGLDYGVLPTVMRLEGVPRADWPEAFTALRILESAALEEMRTKKPKPD